MASMLSVNDEIVAIVGATRILTTEQFHSLDARTQALVRALGDVLQGDRRTSIVHIDCLDLPRPKARTD